MPHWYVKLILRAFIRAPQWREIDALLETALAEHEQVATLAREALERYATITGRVVPARWSQEPGELHDGRSTR